MVVTNEYTMKENKKLEFSDMYESLITLQYNDQVSCVCIIYFCCSLFLSFKKKKKKM